MCAFSLFFSEFQRSIEHFHQSAAHERARAIGSVANTEHSFAEDDTIGVHVSSECFFATDSSPDTMRSQSDRD